MIPARILIVEDDALMRGLLRDHLARSSELEIVAETDSGNEAVTLAEQLRPDIVLMDLSIKGMDGLKATQRIKKSCPDTHVIILTNYALEDLKERAREGSWVQASAFLAKDEIAKRLLPVISSLMREKGGK